MTKLLQGKAALVTGGGSGIGRAAALAFAREGARVAVVDRNIETALRTTKDVEAGGGTALALAADVASEQDVRAMMDHAVKAFGSIDCAFNNAGIGGREVGALSRLAEVEEAAWDRIISINLKGVFLCMKHEILHMMGRGGAIVNTASIAGLLGLYNSSSYVASKHGVIGLTRVAAVEYGADGIRVNAICPGYIQTPLTAARVEQSGTEMRESIPLRRLGQPEDIAELAVFLCSDRSSFCTGAAFTADGGQISGF